MIYRSTILPEKYRISNRRIAFYNANISTIKAVRYLKDQTNIEPILIGNNFSLQDVADKARTSLRNIEIIKTDTILRKNKQSSGQSSTLIGAIYSQLSTDELTDPLLLPIGLMNSGAADVYFIPNDIYLWKLLQSINSQVGYTISGFHLLHSGAEDKTILFSDTCINADPNENILAEIAIRSANNYRKITAKEPRTALLSFSTKGSSQHAMPKIVRRALDIINQKEPSLIIDGELQFDAAVNAEIAAKKAQGSTLAGETNVFIFPNLNAAHIGCKISGTIGNYQSYGAFIQGLNLPIVIPDQRTSYMELVEMAQISTIYTNQLD